MGHGRYPFFQSRWALPLVCLLAFSFTGCVYFNTFFNARKAWREAETMRVKRLDKNPEDTVQAAADERAKLERVIAKSSKVIEVFPSKKKYHPEALFLIARSYMRLGEYEKAIRKFDELDKFFPEWENMPEARFYRAVALFHDGQISLARTALRRAAESAPLESQRLESLQLLARLELESDDPEAALELFEKLVAEGRGDAKSRGTLRFEAGKLAYGLKAWEKARIHLRAAEIGALPTLLRYRASIWSAEAEYALGQTSAAVTAMEATRDERLFFPWIAETQLKLADWYLAAGQRDKALTAWRNTTEQAPKTALSAQAFYRMGDLQLKLEEEKEAKRYFDSAASAGSFEYAERGREKAAALERLWELRARSSDSSEAASPDFMIAELFLFRLDGLDSALNRLDRIVQERKVDSAQLVRAAYARAFIQDEFRQDRVASDSLYNYVLERYPGTSYAKQAEINLGRTVTTRTREDLAHSEFLKAEELYFGGADRRTQVLGAYRQVAEDFPGTAYGSKARFAVAQILEALSLVDPGLRDSAVHAYRILRENISGTPYDSIAGEKLAAIGIQAVTPKESGTGDKSGAEGGRDGKGEQHEERLRRYDPTASDKQTEVIQPVEEVLDRGEDFYDDVSPAPSSPPPSGPAGPTDPAGQADSINQIDVDSGASPASEQAPSEPVERHSPPSYDEVDPY